MTDTPTLTILSLGAGVQSTALLLMAAHGRLPHLDYAVFADTGWEPPEVYAHLDRLDAEVAQPAGIKLLRVSVGNIRDDALDPTHHFASMPLYIRNPDGSEGMARRQCTKEYKLQPIKEAVRRLLGAEDRGDGKPGRVKRGSWVEQWIGISTDERDRALDKDGNLKQGDVQYARNRYPLLELGMDRDRCHALNKAYGFPDVHKSACIGCPYHTNRQWRAIRENPQSWADAVAFDAAMRQGSKKAAAEGHQLRGTAFLHRSRVPLSEAPIDHVPFTEWAQRQTDAVSLLSLQAYEEALTEDEAAQLDGCSPFSCHGEDVEEDT